MATPEPEPGLPRASEETEGSVTRQQQVPTSAPPRSWTRDHCSFYNPHQDSLFQPPPGERHDVAVTRNKSVQTPRQDEKNTPP